MLSQAAVIWETSASDDPREEGSMYMEFISVVFDSLVDGSLTIDEQEVVLKRFLERLQAHITKEESATVALTSAREKEETAIRRRIGESQPEEQVETRRSV